MGSSSENMEDKGAYPPGAPPPQGAYPPPGAYPPGAAAPPGAYPQAPPSYDASFAGTTGGFAEPGKNMQYNQQAPPPQQMIAPPVQNVVVMQTPYFGQDPVQMQCPNCQNQIRTSTQSEASATDWVLGCL